MSKKVKYISHGKHETGGYFHEQFLARTLASEFLNCDLCVEEIRFKKNFKGLLGWINLSLKSFFKGKGDLVVTVSRLAWPVYLRNCWFKNGKLLLVLHNYDKRDGKPKLYYFLLDRFLKLAKRNTDRIAIVVAGKYWQEYFKEKFQLNTFLFYNYLNTEKYYFFRDISQKNKWQVHFGQWSEKIDKKAYYILADYLQKKGYSYYFSSNVEQVPSDFPIIYFQSKEAYLKKMALSHCTIILNKINEGWNRVAQESLLVGTQVFCNDTGGPAELLDAGNGRIGTLEEWMKSEVFLHAMNPIHYENLERWEEKNASADIQPILEWIKE